MAITVDYTVFPWLITIPQSDLTLDTGTKYELEVDTFWELLRDYADSEEGIVYPVIYTRAPASSSTPSITDVNIDYYALQFENGAYSVNVINGNTNIRDAEVKNTVSVNTNNTTGYSFVNVDELNYLSFEGAVCVDAVNGTAGTAYPLGTKQYPVSNVNDAVTIANTNSFNTILFFGDYTLTTGDNVDGKILTAQSPTQTTLTIEAAASTANCEYNNVKIVGVLNGGTVARQCVIDDLTYFDGYLYLCELNGTIELSGGTPATILNCWSGVPGLTTPVIDMTNDQALSLRGYNGGITLRNKTGTSDCSLDIISGQVILESTVTNGTIVVRGLSDLTDNSTGATVVNVDGLVVTGVDGKALLQTQQFVGLK